MCDQNKLNPTNVSAKPCQSVKEKRLYVKMRKYLKKASSLQIKNKTLKSESFMNIVSKNKSINKIFTSKITPKFALLLQGELKNFRKKGIARRWNNEAKITALRLYKRSPTCYRLLRRLICLPAPSMLKSLLNKFYLNVGINKNIFKMLKNTVKLQELPDREYILMFDEMPIKKNLWYNMKKDFVEGYQDHGTQGRTKQIGSYALVFMIAGIIKPLKQPVTYYISSESVSAERLAVLIKEVLKFCFDAGLNIAAIVSDLDGVNKRAATILGATKENPYFTFEEREIVSIFDTPHLLKCFRNLFLKYDIQFEANISSDDKPGVGVAKWSYIKEFYELDSKNPNFVFAPLITEDHINPNTKQKKNVKLAAQVLSHNVAVGMYAKIAEGVMSSEATATANVVANMDKLFDSVNSHTPNLRRGKPLATNLKKNSGHITFFNAMRIFFSNLSFLGCRSPPPSKDGWVWSLNGLERLFRNLQIKHKNIKSLSTRRIQQDPLRNLFGSIRSYCGSNTNPTTGQFIAGLKTAMLSNLSHFGSGNCENDHNDVLLNNFKNFLAPDIDICTADMSNVTSTSSSNMIAINREMSEDICRLIDENVAETIGELQACAYVCGFIIKNNPNLTCESCKNLFLANTQDSIHNFTMLKEYNDCDCRKSLSYASKDIVNLIENCVTIINNYLEKEAHKKDLKEKITKLLYKSIKWDCLDKCGTHKNYNLYYILNSIFYVCVKRFCVLKNRQFSEEAKISALRRKIDILKHK